MRFVIGFLPSNEFSAAISKRNISKEESKMYSSNEAPLLICEVDEVLREIPSFGSPLARDYTRMTDAAPVGFHADANGNARR